jgi:DeoR/GlpR family transcriptional regulator of sugar metabolism
MLAQERRNYIIEMLKENNIVKVNELAKKFNITIETARHDLSILQDQGYVSRIYGGAVPLTSIARETQLNIRENSQRNQKISIGKAAAALIKPGETIFIDNGSTCLELARCVKNIPNLTVCSASIPVLSELVNSDATLIMCGGVVRKGEQAASGALTVNMMDSIYVNKVFTSCSGITVGFGVSSFNIDDAELAKKAISQADYAVLLADSSKFGYNALSIYASIETFSSIVTDRDISEKHTEAIRKLGVDLIIAEQVA